MFEAILRGRSRAQRAALSEDDRAEVDRLIGLIELDPWIDGVHKFSLSMPPIVINLYDNRRWRISYHIVDGRFVEVLAIGRVR